MGLRLKLPLLLSALVLFSLMTACGSAAGPAAARPTPTLPRGWILYEKPADGFALALPPTWREIGLDAAALGTGLQALREQNPQLAEYFSAQTEALLTANGKFFALILTPDSAAEGYMPNITVLQRTLQVELTADELALDFLEELDALPYVVSEPTYRRVPLAAGDAAEIRYDAAIAIPGTPATRLVLSSYLVAKGQVYYVISFGVAASQSDDYAPVFEEIARSFRWLE
jgi:hypothetical protein